MCVIQNAVNGQHGKRAVHQALLPKAVEPCIVTAVDSHVMLGAAAGSRHDTSSICIARRSASLRSQVDRHTYPRKITLRNTQGIQVNGYISDRLTQQLHTIMSCRPTPSGCRTPIAPPSPATQPALDMQQRSEQRRPRKQEQYCMPVTRACQQWMPPTATTEPS